ALVNELAQLCDRMEIDVWEVVEAAATKPFGFASFKPGPGLGGHCIPIDPFYLTWKAREYDFSTRFIELAGEVNNNMPYFCRSLGSAAAKPGADKSVRGGQVPVGRRADKPGLRGQGGAAGEKVHQPARKGGGKRFFPRPARAEFDGMTSSALDPEAYDC